MKKIALLMCALVGAAATTACSSTPAATQADVESVKRRLTSIEQRLRQLEAIAPDPKPNKKGGKDKKTKGGGGKTAKTGKKKRRRGSADEMVDIGVRGGAVKVLLVAGANRYPVPGMVPPGDYVVHASFDESTAPQPVAELATGSDTTMVVDCSASKGSCDVETR